MPGLTPPAEPTPLDDTDQAHAHLALQAATVADETQTAVHLSWLGDDQLHQVASAGQLLRQAALDELEARGYSEHLER